MKFTSDLFLIIPLQIMAILAYFPIARRLRLFDIPNERSSHTYTAFRGGGVIIPISLILYLIFTRGARVDIFLISGILLSSAVSFYDDYRGVNVFVRLISHFISVGFIMKEIKDVLPTDFLLAMLIAIVCVAAVNAYNFMDGINAITGLYTLCLYETIFFYSLYFDPTSHLFSTKILFILSIGLLIFGFYNFRSKAVLFAGDVGSVSLGLLSVFYVLKLIFYNNDIIFLSMVAVYGVEAGLTIFYRLYKRQNIFQAHRMHLFQDLVNKVGWSHLTTSFLYTLLQVLINVGMFIALYNHVPGYYYFTFIIIFLVGLYIILKFQIHKNYTVKNEKN